MNIRHNSIRWLFFLSIIFIAGSLYAQDIALRDLHNLYVTSEFVTESPNKTLDIEEKKSAQKAIEGIFEKIGFNVVGDISQSDAKANVFMSGMSWNFFQGGWLVNGDTRIEFLTPNDSKILFMFESTRRMLRAKSSNANITLDVALTHTLRKVMAEYKKIDPTIRINSDGTIVDILEEKLKSRTKDLRAEMRLSDFNKIYVDFLHVNNETSDIVIQRDEKTREKMKNALRKIGFDVVSQIENSDLMLAFKFIMPSSMGIATVRSVWVEFVLPQNEFLLDKIKLSNDSGLFGNFFRDSAKKIKEKFEEDEKVYKTTAFNKFEELQQQAKEKVVFREDRDIFRTRSSIKLINNKNYSNIGIVTIPILGTKKYAGPHTSPYKFAKGYKRPKLKDKFYDFLKNEIKPSMLYIFPHMKPKDIPSTEKDGANYEYYYWDDLRDVLIDSFFDVMSGFKVNLFEIRYDQYFNDFISHDLEFVLRKIKNDNPDLDNIFVIYYMPFSSWTWTEEKGGFLYTHRQTGLKLHIFLSYYDLSEQSPKYVATYRDDIEYIAKSAVLIPYHGIRTKINRSTNNLLKKMRNSGKCSEFSMNNKISEYFVAAKDAIVFSPNGEELLQLSPKCKVDLITYVDDKAEIIIDGFIDASTVDVIGSDRIKPKQKKVFLLKTPILKNRYDYYKLLSREVDGEFLTDEIIVNRPIETYLNASTYKIRVKGLVDRNLISNNLKEHDDFGSIKGRILMDGVPLGNTNILFEGDYHKVKVKTDKNGKFIAIKICPYTKYWLSLKLEDREEDLGKKKYYHLQHMEALIVNSNENFEAGDIVIDSQKNMFDDEKNKNILKEKSGSLIVGMTKVHSLLYMGEPTKKYTNDVWFYKTDKGDIFIQFKNDIISSISYRYAIPLECKSHIL